MMDKYDVHPGQKDLLEMEKGLIDSCGVYCDGRPFSVSDHVANSCESSRTPERKRNCSSHDCSSSSESAEEITDESRLPSAVTFTSRNSELKTDNCAEKSSSAVPHCKMPTDSANTNDCDISVYSPKGIDPKHNCPAKSDVSTEEVEQVSNESKESNCEKMNELWVGADGEDESKSARQATYCSNQLKGESSYNLTNVILPASSDESCLEILPDVKSGELNKHSYNNASRCSYFKESLEGSPVKRSELALEVQTGMENGICFGGFLPQKHCTGEVVDNPGRRDCDKLLETTEDSNPVNVGAGGIRTRNVPKKGIEEITEAKTCDGLDDALEMVRRDGSETCFSLQERSGETVYSCSTDSAASGEDCLEESGSKNLLENEQGVRSTKDEGDPEMSMRSEELCLDINELSQDTCSIEKNQPNDSLNGSVLFPLTVKPEIVTTSEQLTSVSMFNLNENSLTNRVDDYKNSMRRSTPCYANVLSKPTAAVAKFGIPLCLPKPHLQLDGLPTGWMGSSSTSAFRPTCLTGSFNSTKPSSGCRNDGLRSLHSIGIDLNIAAEGDDCDGEFRLEKFSQEKSSCPKFSIETCSTQTERFGNDLNCICENDQQCLQPNLQTSSSIHSGIAFDLNDDPPSADAHNDVQQSGEGTPVLGDRIFYDHAVKFSGSIRESDPKSVGSMDPADSSYVQSFGHDHTKPVRTAAPNIFPQVEYLQHSAALQHRKSYTAFLPPRHLPLRAFSYGNAVFLDPNDCLSSDIYRTGAIPYVTDLQAASVFPQMPGYIAFPAFSRVPHPMQTPGIPNNTEMAMTRPGFNPDGWVTSSDCGFQGENGRRWFIPVHIARPEEQMRSLQQPAIPMKRKEPEGASNSYHLGFKRRGPRFP